MGNNLFIYTYFCLVDNGPKFHQISILLYHILNEWNDSYSLSQMFRLKNIPPTKSSRTQELVAKVQTKLIRLIPIGAHHAIELMEILILLGRLDAPQIHLPLI